ncbi:MAG TPA: DUF4340 domain-containing protein [Acetobacteraceae bacterium]|nr:DUF4340 domain-containing protein [Acetobacteraceae bacterium]
MMKPRTLALVAALAAGALAAGWRLSQLRDTEGGAAPETVSLAFPDLSTELRRATRVEIMHQGHGLTLELRDGTWRLRESGFYPVAATELNRLFAGLATLRLDEPRTSDPAEFGRLGLDDPARPDAPPGTTGDRVRVLDANGETLAALIVGRRRPRSNGDLPDQLYVRRPEETRSWLAEGQLSVPDQPGLWLDHVLFDIDRGQIASLTATRAGQSLTLARQGNTLALTAPTEHPPLDPHKMEAAAGALEALTFLDVKPAAQTPGEAAGTATYTTTDGMTIGVSLFLDKGEPWARFMVSGNDPEQVRTRVAGWAYAIGAWRQSSLVPVLGDLLAPATPAKPR